jgi:CRISPR/Cas system-associated exonuclease Cas4 (RecB family)
MAHPSLGNKPDYTQHDTHPPYIRASDIGSYLYCRRAWWLERVNGWQPDDVAPRRRRGTVAHQRHGCLVWLSSLVIRLAWLATVALVVVATAMWAGWWPW